jgi:hypothetical protein
LEKWWLQWAYLQWRDPIVPYINTSGFVVNYEVDRESLKEQRAANIDPQVTSAALNSYFYNLFHQELR